ncbi:MAG: 4'-phosphopantetheinyl transferase superfamily protein [Rhodanobacteraceae bacterium]|nr:MAG: 4'-phosphopantetheinyl transferase superfamily protein [Rhodanobacteraceae bacterium]
MSSVSPTDGWHTLAAGGELVFARADPHAAAARLDAGSIHLWRIAYDRDQRRTPLLRMLAAYLGVALSAIELCEGAHGKPLLPARHAGGTAGPLQFNWSHSGNYALIALARNIELGVDIERIGKPRRALEIAGRFFAPGESAALAALGAVARKPAFTGLWCAKEAVLKAVGAGLSFGLERVAFAHLGGAEWELAGVDPRLGEPGAWQVPGFAAAPAYRGALAWCGAPRAVFAFEPAPAGEEAP